MVGVNPATLSQKPVFSRCSVGTRSTWRRLLQQNLSRRARVKNSPRLAYVRIKNLSDGLYRRWLELRKPSSEEYDGVDAGGYYFVTDPVSGRHVFVSHQRRLGYYTKGVQARVENLVREYCLSDLVLSENDVVVDVGAHSGEIGLWAEKSKSRYLAIEPDPVAFGALTRNFPDGQLVNHAVGDKPGTLPFFLNTSTGDSSFQEGSSKKEINVKVQTLDEIVNTAFPDGKISVLKIEAEGFEPEVLKGASQTLARTKIVTVDAGEERNGQSTAPQCLNHLFSSGFQLEAVFLKRGIFRLRSTTT